MYQRTSFSPHSIPTRHAKGGVRRDALYVGTHTSRLTSFCSLALHRTSVFRLNARRPRVIKWFFSTSERRAIDRERSPEDAAVRFTVGVVRFFRVEFADTFHAPKSAAFNPSHALPADSKFAKSRVFLRDVTLTHTKRTTYYSLCCLSW